MEEMAEIPHRLSQKRPQILESSLEEKADTYETGVEQLKTKPFYTATAMIASSTLV